jgi:hypothetical protein
VDNYIAPLPLAGQALPRFDPKGDPEVKYVLIAVGALSLVSAQFLSLYVDRRAFYRRNVAGIEIFNSYSSMLWIRGVDGFALFIRRLLLIVGCCLLVAGIVWK